MLFLSAYDLAYICMALMVFCFPKFSTSYKENIWPYLTPWLIPTLHMSLTGSIYCTVGMTLERYFVICRPFYRFTRKWKPRSFVIPIIIVSIVFNVSRFLEIQTCEKTIELIDNNTNVVIVNATLQCNGAFFTTNVCETHNFSLPHNMTIPRRKVYHDFTDVKLNKTYHAYSMCFNFVVNTFVPFVVLITLNVFIIKQMNRHEKEASKESVTQDDVIEEGNSIIMINVF